jgi:heme/copper-type cytochrome/quinol oxidase subunit 2
MTAPVVVFGICALACLLAHAAILMSVVRRTSTGERPAPAHSSVPRPRLLSEIAWALVPAVALALVLTATWERVRDQGTPKPAEIMKVAR